MIQEQKDILTKQWFMVMLYQSPKSFDNLIENGCRVMVYGQTYENLKKLFDELQRSDTDMIKSSGGNFALTSRGSFEVKRNTILPLIKLAEDPKMLDAFIKANRETCDIQFLESLAECETEGSAIAQIKDFAKEHYSDIAKILTIMGTAGLANG